MRKNSKQRKAQFRTAFDKTGNRSPPADLHPNDERICDIFGEHGLGLSIVKELGFC